MPSLAIVRDNFNHSRFGEISILFDKASIDPQASSDNKVYSGDAWTPTYPQVDYKVNDVAAQRIKERVDAVKRLVPNRYDGALRRIGNLSSLEDTLNSARGETGLINEMLQDYDMKQMYLAETAEVVPEQFTETRKELSDDKVEEYEAILKYVGSEDQLSGSNVLEAKKEWLRTEKNLSEEEIQDEVGSVRKFRWNVIASQIKDYAENGRVTIKREFDMGSTNAMIDERIDAEEYRAWIEELFAGVEEDHGIYNGKDLYTTAGNRRASSQLHYAETLENVVAAMKQETQTGKSLFGSNIIGAGKKELSSIDEIRENKSRLGTVSEEELYETEKDIESRFSEIAEAFVSSDSWTAVNSAKELMIEAIQNRKTKSGIAAYLKKEGAGWTQYSDQITDDLLSLVQEVSNLPTQYFEAKPRRAVEFDEVKAVVLPAESSQELKTLLSERGINAIEYDGTEEDRLAKVNAAADQTGVKFQLKDSDGNSLSEQQAEYFKDSKVRDEAGRLLVMYHGTPEAGFTEFHEGTYFTQNKEYADVYQNPGASSLRVKQSADNPSTYQVYLNIKKPFDTRNAKEREIFENEYYRQWGTGTPLMESGLPDWMDGMDLQEFIEEMEYDYDGLILDEGGTGGYGQEVKSRGVSYVVFDPSQVKNIDNQNPTDSPDIRYQLKNSDIREFNMTKQQALDNMKAVAEMEPVVTLSGNEFQKGSVDLITQVSDFFNSIGKGIANSVLGYIELTKRGVKSSMGHGFSRPKVVAFKAVPEIIAKGKIIDAQRDWKGRGFDTVVLAAPIVIGTADYYAAVIVKRQKNSGYQKYYLHELGVILKSGTPKTGTLSRNPGSNTAPLNNLLQQLNSVNSLTEKDIVSDEGRFQLKDENTELRKQLTAEKELSAKLRAEFKRSKIAVPDQKQTGKAVTALMDAYLGKRMPKLHQSIMQDINQVFSEMRKPDGNWNLVDDLCRNAADKIVSNMEILHDEYWKQYSDLRSTLHQTTLKLDETYWKDIVDFEDFRKAHFGTVRISKKKGISIDSFYQELSEMYPELFDAAEYTNEVDQLYNIIDTIEGMRPYTEDYSEGEIAEFADTIAADVLQMSYDLNQKETFADKKYNEKIQAINKERVKANAKTREKLDKQKDMLTSKARAEKAAALAKEREKNLAKIEKIKTQNREMMQRQRTRAKERLEKKDQFYKDKIKKAKEQNKDRKDRKYYTSRIEAYSQWLSDSLLRPTDTRHIPENYRKAVAEMLESFDFSTDRTDAYTEKNGPSKKTLKLAALNQAYRELVDQESSMIEPDDEIAKLIEDLSVALEGKRFADLDTDQLAGVYRLVKNIRFAISSVNKAFSDGLRERISDYGEKIINETASMKEKKQYGDMRQSISNFLNESNVTPGDAFLLMGDTMQELYQNMRNGFNKHIDNTTQIKSFAGGLVKEYKVKSWIDKKAQPRVFELESGKSIELVPSQVMSLYCLMQREQAKNHILASGVTSAPLPVFDGKMGKVTLGAAKRKLSQTQVMLTYDDTQNIIASLTAEQKTVADELQNFMSTICADWGNETTMKMYGYKKFKEKNYFPIKSSDIYLQESFDRSQPSKLKNVGFTKNTVVNANNPIVLDDIFSVFSQHANTMSMYNALVPAITDFERVYNFKLKSDGKDFASVKGNLKRAYGDQVNRYITNFMNDLNQNYAKNKDHEMAEKLVANYKKAKIGFSLRVFLQQPTAVTRAAAVMSPKYFLSPSVWQSMMPGVGRKVRNEMFEHCQIARWKSWGFYNTDVSRDMREIFLDEKGIADEVFMGIYGKADDMTWGTIWKAVKKEVEHERKDLEVGSDAYWNAVNERFSYVVDRTQVVDSVFHRSQIMRKKDLFSKITTSFMAEPTKTYNLLHTEAILAHREAAAGNKKAAAKRLSRICTVYLATALSTAMAAAVADAIRGFGDDDKDKDYAERWADYTIANFKDMANPLGLLPGYRDIASLFQGYDLDRTDMVGIKELIDSFAYWESETATKYYALKKTVAAISTVTGIPVGNVWREVESAAKTYKTVFEGRPEAAFFADKLRFDIYSDRNRSKFAYDYAMAADKGDTVTAKKIQQEVLAAGTDKKKFQASVNTQAKNLAAKQAAQAVIDGNEAEAKRLIRQCCNKYGGEYEKLWVKVEEEIAKRKSIFQRAYDATLARLINGER